MNEPEARAAFEAALVTYRPGFGSFFLARLMGLDLRYEGARCVVEFAIKDWMFNPQGTLHGGIIGTVLDISMGHLLHHIAGAGATLEMKTQYLCGLTGNRALATASFLRRGRSINFLESRMTDDADRLVAAATSTWRLL